jgi:uncharacterized protein YbaR (Trm112 family)
MLSYTNCPVCKGPLKVDKFRYLAKCNKCGMHFRKWTELASCTMWKNEDEELKYSRWEPLGDYEAAMMELEEEFPGLTP